MSLREVEPAIHTHTEVAPTTFDITTFVWLEGSERTRLRLLTHYYKAGAEDPEMLKFYAQKVVEQLRRSHRTYQIVEEGKAIRCLDCGLTSWHPKDVKNRYCGKCFKFHNDPPEWPAC